MAPGERTMKKEMTVRWRSEEAERVIDELEQENAQLKQELEAKVTDGGTEGETRSSGGKRKRATDPVDELQRASLHLASGNDRAQRLQIAIWSYEDTLAEELEAETKNTLAELEAETEKAVDACTDAIRVANASVNNTISKGLTPLINGLHDDQVQSYQAPMGRLGPEALKVATAGGDWARLDRFQNFRPIPVLDQSHGAGEDPIHIQYKQPFQSLTENQEGCIDQAHVHAQVEEVAAKKSPASPVVVDLTSTLQDPVFGHLPSENERIKELEQENAQLKKEEISNRRCLEEAQGVIDELEKENAQLKEEERSSWWCLDEAQRLVNKLAKEKERIKALEQENAQLKQELAAKVTDATEGETSSGGKRRRTTEGSEKARIPELPTEIWTKIAAKIGKNDVMAFALTSKQLREAQQQAGRKLVTRLHWERLIGSHQITPILCANFSRDWCAWWSRRFNMTETAPECMNRVIRISAYCGYLDVLVTYWSDIPKEKKSLLMDKWTCAAAAEGGHLVTLQWLRSQGRAWNEGTCNAAAWNGHLEVLQWARIQGCPWSADTSLIAAGRGHLEVLQFLLDNECPRHVIICDFAARSGHLSVLKYLRQMGCRWNANTTLWAARGGHLEVLQWLRFEGCPWIKEACRREGKPNIVRWIDKLRAL